MSNTTEYCPYCEKDGKKVKMKVIRVGDEVYYLCPNCDYDWYEDE